MRAIINQLIVEQGAAVARVVGLGTLTLTWIYSSSLKLTTQRIDVPLRYVCDAFLTQSEASLDLSSLR